VSCYRTILVALDSSGDAQAALAHAATLARDQRACLVVLSVVPETPPLQLAGSPAAGQMPAIEDALARALRAAVASVPQDVSVQSRLARGRPARKILEVAEECRCDLIVMGFHGHGRWHDALIGSVSGTVLRESSRPVLLMRGGRAVERAEAAAGDLQPTTRASRK
jgi:nucleotide-binding universal stress UspA family protein